jgi:hypothetical protein
MRHLIQAKNCFYLIFLLQTQIFFAQINNKDVIPSPTNLNYQFINKVNPLYNNIAKNILSKNTRDLFLQNVQVNADAGNLINDFAPVISISPQNEIYVVWNGDEITKSILFAKSTDGGTTFSTPKKINDDVAYPFSYSVYQPDICLDNDGAIYVVWHDYRAWVDDNSWTSPIDIYLDKSTDGGITWNTDLKVSDGTGTYPWHFQPSMAIDKQNNYIYVSFSDYDRYYPQGDLGDINIVVSSNQAVSFNSKVRVDNTPDSLLVAQSFSSVTVDSATHNVYVVFEDSRNGNKDIYLAKSTDFGNSFVSNVLVNTDTINAQEEPSIKVDKSGYIYIVWKDWKADSTVSEAPYLNDIYFSKSTDAGNAFSIPTKVTDQFMNAENGYNFPPRLVLDNLGRISVVWHDNRLGYSTCFYDQSIDGGQTFGEDIVIPDNTDSISHALPRLYCDNKNDVFVVWMDKRNTNNLYDIFIAKKQLITATDNDNLSVAEYSLNQNFPNPFNPVTTIRFSITMLENVNLKIYDILGNEIATLLNEEKPAGTYEVKFNTSTLKHQPSSGVYYYQLKAGSFISTKSMVLLK